MKTMTVYGDGAHDDTEAIQAYFNGEAELFFPDGRKFGGMDSRGIFLVSKTIVAGVNECPCGQKEMEGK